MANDDITRRAFLKGAAALAALVPAGALLSACGAQPAADPQEPAAEPEAPAADDQAASEQPAADAVSPSVLVAYYSATGNTEAVANLIASRLGADTFAIEPAEPYTDADLNYNDPDSRTSRERSDGDRAVELAQTTPEGFDGYDAVFIGYPIWWGDASWVVDGFVSGNDFTGKTVVPFCTSASSSLGQSGQNLAALAGTGDWLAGARFSGGASEAEVAAWVDGLGL